MEPAHANAGGPGRSHKRFFGLGRPVDLAVQQNGSMLITDDQSGTIYKLTWSPSAVSAANGYPVIAPNSYATVYGSALATQTAVASPPYPGTLGGVSLTLKDASGQSFPASLVFVSSSQINFIVPAGIGPGSANVELETQSGTRELGTSRINSAAPALFTLSGDGNGTAAATAVDSSGKTVPVFQCSSLICSEVPVEVGSGQIFLSLFGTGIRGADTKSVQVLIQGNAVPVSFAGAQPTYPGLDQINVQLPASLAGAGRVTVQISIAGITSNFATVTVQ